LPRALVVPGVSVATRFEVAPPLPARSGILGAVGVVDRGLALATVTTAQELLEKFGPATLYSFPEVLSALANGISEVVVSPVDPRSGAAASVTLQDDEGDDVAVLRARAAGPWGNDLAVRLSRVMAADGRTVRRVSLEVLLGGRPIERHENLVLDPGNDFDFFEGINRDSQTIVAIDPIYQTDLPVQDGAPRELPNTASAASSGVLRRAGANLIRLTARRRGPAGDRISAVVREGRASLVLLDGGGNPALRVRATAAGDDAAAIQIAVTTNVAGGVDLEVRDRIGNVRSYAGGFTDVAAIVAALDADPDLDAIRLGDVPPAVIALTRLAATRSVTLTFEGVSTEDYEDLANAQAAIDAFNEGTIVTAELLGDAAVLPDTVPISAAVSLRGGRDAGRAAAYDGENNPGATVLVLVPAEGTDATITRVRMARGSQTGTVRLLTGVDAGAGFVQREEFDNLTMDPDDLRYLPRVLQDSTLVRAIDLYERSRGTHFPAATRLPSPLIGGAAPNLAAYQAAIDALEAEEAVDLLLAGFQGWRDSNLDGLAVQRHMVGHARSQADAAHPRIALGSIRPNAEGDVGAIVDHSSQLADRRFVLVAPSGAEGALAGLLGHLEFFQSPTFKTIASPGVTVPRYSDGELNKLVGSEGNICVIQSRRGRGTICLKGIATSGDQISVTRVADNAVRTVKTIADKFIGELNNADSRNALKQMIVAMFTQMERDGAIVPSVDGESPSFIVDVYASQTDTAGGIVRIDLAVRPVRAIDYIYATITVKN